MSDKIKVAVSGNRGSFSEEAGKWYLQREGLDGEIIYSIDPEGVLCDLEAGKAEIGIYPVVNSRGGLVMDSYEMMGRHNFKLLDHVVIEVQQCLVVLPGTNRGDIKQFASHPQAFAQCEKYLLNNFPNTPHVKWDDTAKAAEDLRSGKLSPNTAVIASAVAAKNNELEIMEKGIQDARPNLTTFLLVKI